MHRFANLSFGYSYIKRLVQCYSHCCLATTDQFLDQRGGGCLDKLHMRTLLASYTIDFQRLFVSELLIEVVTDISHLS